MIEVQLISSPTDNPDWSKECVNGLFSPVVRLHRGESVINNINAARISVWDRCGGDLLTCVDPDDIPLAHIWQKFQDTMDANPDALGVYCLEQRINSGGSVIGYQPDTTGKDPVVSPLVVHHTVVIRRCVYEFVRPFALLHNCGIEWLLATAAFNTGKLICIPEVGYQWRKHARMSTGNNAALRYPPSLGYDFLKWAESQPKLLMP